MDRNVCTMLCTRQYCKIINLFTFKVVDLCLFEKQQHEIPMVGQTRDLLANMFDKGFSPAQGITQY